jgi:hypothetical protein
MSDTAEMGRKREGPQGRRPLVDDELADQLLERAEAEGAELLGPDGLLSQVTKAVLERALAEEMTGHLGYASGSRPLNTATERCPQFPGGCRVSASAMRRQYSPAAPWLRPLYAPATMPSR